MASSETIDQATAGPQGCADRPLDGFAARGASFCLRRPRLGRPEAALRGLAAALNFRAYPLRLAVAYDPHRYKSGRL
jgi:hypothetical protein